MVSKGLSGEDLPQCYGVRVLDLLPHVHQHHALGVDKAETWTRDMEVAITGDALVVKQQWKCKLITYKLHYKKGPRPI